MGNHCKIKLLFPCVSLLCSPAQVSGGLQAGAETLADILPWGWFDVSIAWLSTDRGHSEQIGQDSSKDRKTFHVSCTWEVSKYCFRSFSFFGNSVYPQSGQYNIIVQGIAGNSHFKLMHQTGCSS